MKPLADIFEDAMREQREAIESEADRYGARAVPFVCATTEELAEWFLGFAEACCVD